jgi:hypothetical protein
MNNLFMKIYEIDTQEESVSVCVYMSLCNFHCLDFGEILNGVFALYEA